MTNVEIMIVLVVIFVLLIGLATAVIIKNICELAVDLHTNTLNLIDVIECVSDSVESINRRTDLIHDRIDLNDETVKQLIDIFRKMTKE